MPSESQIRDALSSVIDPELRKNIVDARHGPLDRAARRTGASTSSCRSPRRAARSAPTSRRRSSRTSSALDGVEHVSVGFDVLSDDEKQTLAQRLGRQGGLPEGALAAVKNVICVGSGKGGVGKSTLTANLAAALQAEGQQAAALDADVWGYSIPRMLGVHGRPARLRPSARSCRSRPTAA